MCVCVCVCVYNKCYKPNTNLTTKKRMILLKINAMF